MGMYIHITYLSVNTFINIFIFFACFSVIAMEEQGMAAQFNEIDEFQLRCLTLALRQRLGVDAEAPPQSPQPRTVSDELWDDSKEQLLQQLVQEKKQELQGEPVDQQSVPAVKLAKRMVRLPKPKVTKPQDNPSSHQAASSSSTSTGGSAFAEPGDLARLRSHKRWIPQTAREQQYRKKQDDKNQREVKRKQKAGYYDKNDKKPKSA